MLNLARLKPKFGAGAGSCSRPPMSQCVHLNMFTVSSLMLLIVDTVKDDAHDGVDYDYIPHVEDVRG